ncbi:sulfurtransferase [Halalkalibacterium ligniniphilum]|uniref:sulfurtransferase n=1 Tax=Halalkalibacterium ligniniphilum TaxID=1134413 RepID=UPI0003496746|nr:sulfurtransferase [Halalkalibacterium ligniniphilum]
MEQTVSLSWLKEHLQDENVRVVDCRFSLGQPEVGLQAYIKGHIPGAVFFDLDQDLSGKPQAHGGRHPLPDIDELARKLSSAGIDRSTTVVAYDNQGGPFASRFWWLLRYLGHEQVYVLNETYDQWLEAGYPVDTDVPIFQEKAFQPLIKEDMQIEYEELKEKRKRPNITLIDSRELERYQGKSEPIDPIAGRIPGAIHHFWKDNVTAKGERKPLAEQRERFSSLNKEDEIIVYCGSGVSACPNVLTLVELGYQNVRLYVGSWSDWITHDDREIETDVK